MLRHNLSVDNIIKAIRRPKEAIDDSVFELFYRVPVTYANTRTTIGTNIFSRDWDVLVLLDTCRVDALRAVSDEYDFLDEINSITSVGGRSPEWIAKTFDNQYAETISDTAYLSANVFSKKILVDQEPRTVSLRESTIAYKLLGRIPTVTASQLGKFEYLYKFEPVGESGPLGHEQGGTPPRYVTDRAIRVNRNHDFDRLILHYLQPHPPYMSNALKEDRPLKRHETDWWGHLAETDDRETIWKTYLDELRFVLDEIELLLNNLEAPTVVISADHGESFGEYWEYGHKTGSLNPYVRTVPWVTTSASDSGTYTSEFDPPKEESTNNVNNQLEALGYKV